MKQLIYSLNNIWTIVIFLAFVIVGLLLIFPLYNIFVASFLDNETGVFTLQNYTNILGRRYYRTAIYNSVIVGLSSMVGALIIGIPLAFFTSRYNIKGKSLISTLAILALVSPPFYWCLCLDNDAWLKRMVTSWFGVNGHSHADNLRTFGDNSCV